MIGCGWHTSDAHDMMDSHVVDQPNFPDRDGTHRPKLTFKDFDKTKEKDKKVSNTVGCGCLGAHDPNNTNCLYALIKRHQELKKQSDNAVMASKTRMSYQARKAHWDADGNWRESNFFRAIGRDNSCHQIVCATRYPMRNYFARLLVAQALRLGETPNPRRPPLLEQAPLRPQPRPRQRSHRT